jgi:hypothetical protein
VEETGAGAVAVWTAAQAGPWLRSTSFCRTGLRLHAAGTPRAASDGVESPLLRKRIASVAGGPPVAAA